MVDDHLFQIFRQNGRNHLYINKYKTLEFDIRDFRLQESKTFHSPEAYLFNYDRILLPGANDNRLVPICALICKKTGRLIMKDLAFAVYKHNDIFHYAPLEYIKNNKRESNGRYSGKNIWFQDGMILAKDCFNIYWCTNGVRFVQQEENRPGTLYSSTQEILIDDMYSAFEGFTKNGKTTITPNIINYQTDPRGGYYNTLMSADGTKLLFKDYEQIRHVAGQIYFMIEKSDKKDRRFKYYNVLSHDGNNVALEKVHHPTFMPNSNIIHYTQDYDYNMIPMMDDAELLNTQYFAFLDDNGMPHDTKNLLDIANDSESHLDILIDELKVARTAQAASAIKVNSTFIVDFLGGGKENFNLLPQRYR